VLTGERTLGQGLQGHRDPITGELVYTETTAAGVSIFDPVLCELAYRWFSPPGGHVLDPFAGGSVRGIVAAALQRAYVGVELRGEQVEANQAQLPILDRLDGDTPAPVWHTGDSLQVLPALDVAADLVFSCPPYADLEVYSDDPADLSNMPYDDFLTAYRAIIAAACARLRDDRFAVWVVGDVRDKRGLYRGLVPDTIAAFTDAGLSFYNEAVLVTPVGSLPIRAGRQFAAGRKLGKTHQNVLVFCKGDPRAAAAACGEVEVTMPEVVDN
jgi:DNA modification methylase